MRNRLKISLPLCTLLIIAAGVHAQAHDAALLAANRGAATRGDHGPVANIAEFSSRAIAVRSARETAVTLDGTSGQDAFTAEEKAAIEAAIIANHPSVTVLGGPTRSYDCHGFTFAAGRRWIGNGRVEDILAEQGWILRAAGAHRVGDIAIYRENGAIQHSGIVSAVQDGTVVRIQSKWGVAGLYEHGPNDVPEGYGQFEIRHRAVAVAVIPLRPFDLEHIRGLCLANCSISAS